MDTDTINTATSRRAHVLYLEDDADSVELVNYTLAAAGIAVTAVDSADQALQLAAEREFDLFLLDGLLPTGYSFDLCPKLRAAAPGTPIVFYTALGFPTEVQQGADAGADAYLVKPFLGDLAETLTAIMEGSRNKLYGANPNAVNELSRAAT